MTTKTELMLAFWPNAELRQYWHTSESSKSLWLEIRSVEISQDDEGKQTIQLDTYGLDGAQCTNVGIYLWASSGGFTPVVELKAHDIYSASAIELNRLYKWLTKYNAKISRATIPANFGIKEKLILTLLAMGIKRGIKIEADWSSPTRYEINSVEHYLTTLPNYAEPLAEMEALNHLPYRGFSNA